MINTPRRLVILCALGFCFLTAFERRAESSPRLQNAFEGEFSFAEEPEGDFDGDSSFGDFADEADEEGGFSDETSSPEPAAQDGPSVSQERETADGDGDLGVVPGKSYSPDSLPQSHDSLTLEESLDLLDRAEAALASDANMSPLETIQAVSVLLEHGRERLTTPYMKSLLRRFNDRELTDRELFDIADRLGAAALAKILTHPGLSPESGVAIDRILKGYQEHVSEKDAVESVLLWKELKTPKELVSAANELSKVGRIEIAGVLLKRFLDTEATPEELAEINVAIGTADIIRILTEESLQPQGHLVVERIVEGTRVFRESLKDEPIAQELQRLRTGRPEDVTESIHAVWRGSQATIPELIDLLCVTQDQQELAEIGALLRSMGNDALHALAVMLESDEVQSVQRCAQVLYSRVAPESAYLFYPGVFNSSLDEQTRAILLDYVLKLTSLRPTPEDAARILAKIAREYAGHDRVLRIDAEGQCTIWILDPEQRKPKLLRLPAEDAFRVKSSQLASYAYRIAPESPDVKTCYFLSRFEQVFHESGLEESFEPESSVLNRETDGLSLGELETILAGAVKDEASGAGIVAARLLGKRGTAEELLYSQTNAARRSRKFAAKATAIRPLVRATQSSDRRIRYAATEAVMRLQPAKAYPGSSLVSDALLWFARSEGKRRVVIGSPKTDEAMRLAGWFRELGYITTIVDSSGEVMKEALASPDVEIVFVDARCRGPIVPVFAQNMRIDAKTHEIPIAIFSRDETMLKAPPIVKPLPLMSDMERSLSNTTFMDSLAMIVPHPQSLQTTEFLVQRLKTMTGVRDVPAEVRLAQAKNALVWIAALTERHANTYRMENLELLARETAYSTVLYEEGTALLALIRSNGAQHTLVDIAMRQSFPLQTRTAAKDAFLKSVEKHGILIRGRQVRALIDTLTRQYEQESPDPVLETIMDAIELRTAGR